MTPTNIGKLVRTYFDIYKKSRWISLLVWVEFVHPGRLTVTATAPTESWRRFFPTGCWSLAVSLVLFSSQSILMLAPVSRGSRRLCGAPFPRGLGFTFVEGVCVVLPSMCRFGSIGLRWHTSTFLSFSVIRTIVRKCGPA